MFVFKILFRRIVNLFVIPPGAFVRWIFHEGTCSYNKFLKEDMVKNSIWGWFVLTMLTVLIFYLGKGT